MKTALLAAAVLLALVPGRARAASDCEGICDDGSGSSRTVTAGPCRADEACRAGCDTSEPGVARPYAACVSTVTGRERAPQAVTDPGGRREHD